MMLSRTSAPASRRRTISNQRDGAFAFPVAPPFSLSQIDDGRTVGALQMFDHQRQLAAFSRDGDTSWVDAVDRTGDTLRLRLRRLCGLDRVLRSLVDGNGFQTSRLH